MINRHGKTIGFSYLQHKKAQFTLLMKAAHNALIF
ncbi:Uncharacterised protein [Serratia quinivorans]|nr:Uncharacterised protein [Serratia quinivorans]CAI0791213.1 Uncharacterised protein [Serratia quinivorans]CAI0831418.1 Uncharacterised protein [Serratia quinivorans]CAI0948130.1 Uncharacterised protein [Serratia quinivorans]CAI0965171.1 Uncharacterised protein [Serratia quinivorans]